MFNLTARATGPESRTQMAQPVVVSGVKVVKADNGKYVATDTWYPNISQDGMEFNQIMTALKYANAKRRLNEIEKEMNDTLNEISNMIQAEALVSESN